MSPRTPDDISAVGVDNAPAATMSTLASEIGDHSPSAGTVPQSQESIAASSASQRHMPQLDGLRAVAVFAVIFYHTLGGRNAFFDAFPWAYAGVELFFVISGFLITGILLRERDRAEQLGLSRLAPLKPFYCRRFLRIFPLYYAVLFVLACGVPGVRNYFFWYLTYTSNFLRAFEGEAGFMRSGGIVAGHFWTLAIEEQFYLVWPWLILLVPRTRLPMLLWMTVATGVLSRSVFVAYGAEINTAEVITTSNLDSLALGALVAYGHLQVRWASGMLLAGGSLISIILLQYLAPAGARTVFLAFFLALGGSLLVRRSAIGFAGILGWMLCNPVSRFLGKISYGLYVYHFPVIASLSRMQFFRGDRESCLVDSLVVTMATLILATVSWYLFESPINNLKRRFLYV